MAERSVPIGPVTTGYAAVPIQTGSGPSVLVKYETPLGDFHFFMDVAAAAKHAKSILDACRQAGTQIVTPPKKLIVPRNGVSPP